MPGYRLTMSTEDSSPRIDVQDAPDGQRLLVRGAWTAADLTAKPAWDALTAQLASLPRADRQAEWDLGPVEKLEYLGAQVLWNHWGRAWPARLQIDPHQREMLETVAQFAVRPAKVRAPDWRAPVLLLGSRLLGLLDHAKGLVQLVGQLLLDIGRLIRRPQQGPWRDLSGNLYHIGATALPITALVG
ncbi:MAG: ABC transporter permease, partial [Polaromonas sp.]|nr:ABC transporter permease [Polaromonas sp.]